MCYLFCQRTGSACVCITSALEVVSFTVHRPINVDGVESTSTEEKLLLLTSPFLRMMTGFSNFRCVLRVSSSRSAVMFKKNCL